MKALLSEWRNNGYSISRAVATSRLNRPNIDRKEVDTVSIGQSHWSHLRLAASNLPQPCPQGRLTISRPIWYPTTQACLKYLERTQIALRILHDIFCFRSSTHLGKGTHSTMGPARLPGSRDQPSRDPSKISRARPSYILLE